MSHSKGKNVVDPEREMSSFVAKEHIEPETLGETDEELNRGLETIRQLVAEYECIVRDTDELNETQEARVREIQSIMMSAPMIKVQEEQKRRKDAADSHKLAIRKAAAEYDKKWSCVRVDCQVKYNEEQFKTTVCRHHKVDPICRMADSCTCDGYWYSCCDQWYMPNGKRTDCLPCCEEPRHLSADK